VTRRFWGLSLAAAIAALGGFGFALSVPAQAQTSAPSAPGGYQGTGQGNLTLDGKPIPLKYVYAVQVDNVEEEGLPLTISPRKYIVLLLSDISLPKRLVENRFAPQSDRHSMAEFFDDRQKSIADKMRGLQFRIDAEKKELFGMELLLPVGAMSFAPGGIGEANQIKDLKIENGTISGTVLVTAPQEHPSWQIAEAEKDKKYKGPKKYQYRVAFTAPLQTEPPVTKVYDGKDALNNEPMTVLKQYAAAAKKGDIATVKRLTAASHQTYLNHPKIKEQMQQMKPDLLVKEVKRVVIRGDWAAVMVVSSGGGAQIMIQMTRTKDGWKLYFP
jgi:hypothetical protein